jgi:hypothetical protein
MISSFDEAIIKVEVNASMFIRAIAFKSSCEEVNQWAELGSDADIVQMLWD